jgi:hypothetical protein
MGIRWKNRVTLFRLPAAGRRFGWGRRFDRPQQGMRMLLLIDLET